jgi:hypothetical protein
VLTFIRTRDDLDDLVARADAVQRDDLLILRVQR